MLVVDCLIVIKFYVFCVVCDVLCYVKIMMVIVMSIVVSRKDVLGR